MHALALKNRGCPDIFYCFEHAFFTIQHFLATSASPEKKVAQKFFALCNILFTFRIFEQLALTLKNRGYPEFTILNVFFIIQDFWATCACPENFRCIEYIFYYSGVLSNLRLPWKQSCPGIFHCIEYTFYIQNFWVTCACLKNRGCPEVTVLNVYFLLFKIFEQLALALRNRVALEFFTVLKYISLFRIFEELAVALKTEFALKFFKPGGAAAPPAPRLVRLCLQWIDNFTMKWKFLPWTHEIHPRLGTTGLDKIQSADVAVSVWIQAAKWKQWSGGTSPNEKGSDTPPSAMTSAIFRIKRWFCSSRQRIRFHDYTIVSYSRVKRSIKLQKSSECY